MKGMRYFQYRIFAPVFWFGAAFSTVCYFGGIGGIGGGWVDGWLCVVA